MKCEVDIGSDNKTQPIYGGGNMYNSGKDGQMQCGKDVWYGELHRNFTLIELLVVIAIIAIVVASKVGFFLQFSAIFAFKAL